MQTIAKLNLKQLSKDHLEAYLRDVVRLIREDMAGEPDWAKPYIYSVEVLQKMTAPTETKPGAKALAEADRIADSAWYNLNIFLKLNVRHRDEKIRAAAEAVKDIFDQIENPTALAYSIEYGKLEIILNSLKEMDAEIDACGARPWVDDLQDGYDGFMALYKPLFDDASKKVVGEVTEARFDCIRQYRHLTEAIQVLMRLSPTSDLDKLAGHINELVNRNKLLIKTRKTSKGKKEEEASGD